MFEISSAIRWTFVSAHHEGKSSVAISLSCLVIECFPLAIVDRGIPRAVMSRNLLRNLGGDGTGKSLHEITVGKHEMGPISRANSLFRDPRFDLDTVHGGDLDVSIVHVEKRQLPEWLPSVDGMMIKPVYVEQRGDLSNESRRTGPKAVVGSKYALHQPSVGEVTHRQCN